MTDTNAPSSDPMSDADLEAIGAYRGCGDNSCDTARPGGMGTNGGCRCIDPSGRLFPDERMKLRGHLRARREQVTRLLGEVRRLRAEIAALRKDLATMLEAYSYGDDDVTWRACYSAGMNTPTDTPENTTVSDALAAEPMLQWFAFAHLPAHLQEASAPFHVLAWTLVGALPRNPERTVALRKLLEAKDCAVRALLYK